MLVQVFMTLIKEYTLVFDGLMAVGLFNFFSGVQVTQAECSTCLFLSSTYILPSTF